MVRRGTKPRRCPVMPAGLVAVVPAGLWRRVAPAPHARMEVAGAGLRLVLERLDGVWRRAAKVRRRVVSWFSHTAHSKVFPGSTMKWCRGKSLVSRHAVLTWPCFAPFNALVTSAKTGRTPKLYAKTNFNLNNCQNYITTVHTAFL